MAFVCRPCQQGLCDEEECADERCACCGRSRQYDDEYEVPGCLVPHTGGTCPDCAHGDDALASLLYEQVPPGGFDASAG